MLVNNYFLPYKRKGNLILCMKLVNLDNSGLKTDQHIALRGVKPSCFHKKGSDSNNEPILPLVFQKHSSLYFRIGFLY